MFGKRWWSERRWSAFAASLNEELDERKQPGMYTSWDVILYWFNKERNALFTRYHYKKVPLLGFVAPTTCALWKTASVWYLGNINIWDYGHPKGDSCAWGATPIELVGVESRHETLCSTRIWAVASQSEATNNMIQREVNLLKSLMTCSGKRLRNNPLTNILQVRWNSL